LTYWVDRNKLSFRRHWLTIFSLFKDYCVEISWFWSTVIHENCVNCLKEWIKWIPQLHVRISRLKYWRNNNRVAEMWIEVSIEICFTDQSILIAHFLLFILPTGTNIATTKIFLKWYLKTYSTIKKFICGSSVELVTTIIIWEDTKLDLCVHTWGLILRKSTIIILSYKCNKGNPFREDKKVFTKT